MVVNETLWDEEGSHMHSREFSVAGIEFRFLIADDYRSYSLFVTLADGTVETIRKLRSEVVEWRAETVFEAYHSGDLRRHSV